MKTTTIYITANFCGCLFCKGSYKITNDLDKKAFLAASQGGFKTYLTGGRNPDLITYDPEKFLVGYVSANGKCDIQDPFTGNYCGLDNAGPEVFLTADSVHGCWKITANQEFRLFLRPEFYDTEVKTINTRGD